jgi:hypothetical protein
MARGVKADMEQPGANVALVTPPNGGRPARLVPNGAMMPKQRRVSLPTTPKKALAEAARVYVEARRGQLHVEDAARLSYALKNCADVHRDHVLNAKVDALKESVERIARILSEKGHAL